MTSPRPIFASSEIGSRAATRVKIASPIVRPSVFDGWRGIVVRVHERTLLVRLTTTPHGLSVENPATLAFDRSEVLDLDPE